MGIKITKTIHAINRIKRLSSNALLRVKPRAVILLYHRIADIRFDPNLIHVTPEHFAEHLFHLKKYYHLISLKDLVSDLAKNRVTHRTVAITIDDGYVDNLWNAKPLLEFYNVPATIFVSTGGIDKNNEFWWDRLERIIFSSKELPEQFKLILDNKLHEWDLHKMNNKDALIKIYMEIQLLLRNLEDNKIEEALKDLSNIFKTKSEVRLGYRTMNSDELNTFANNGLYEIGGHSITHPILTKLPLEIKRQELLQSKKFLEDLLCRPVENFSFPYGYWDEQTISLIKECGYKAACSTIRFPVLKRNNLYLLPRFGVKDWNGDEFAKRIRCFFNAPG